MYGNVMYYELEHPWYQRMIAKLALTPVCEIVVRGPASKHLQKQKVIGACSRRAAKFTRWNFAKSGYVKVLPHVWVRQSHALQVDMEG